MLAFLKLIRFPNLLIIAATQCLMRYCIVHPLLNTFSHTLEPVYAENIPIFTLQMGGGMFALLVLATVFLAAAGYVINDYFDTKTDRLNRPETVVVGTLVARRTAMKLHLALSFLGVLMGFIVSIRVGRPLWGFVFVLVSGILWFYSTTYKRQFLLGNILVALLTAMVPFMVALFEIPLLVTAYSETMIIWGINYNLVLYWVMGFSFFAFVTTLTREIIKDAEDFEGDRAYGRNTLPVVVGMRWTSVIAIGLNLITVVSLSFVWYRFLRDVVTLVYIGVAVILPLLVVVFLLAVAKGQKHFHRASLLMKGIMLAGLLYSVVASYLLDKLF